MLDELLFFLDSFLEHSAIAVERVVLTIRLPFLEEAKLDDGVDSTLSSDEMSTISVHETLSKLALEDFNELEILCSQAVIVRLVIDYSSVSIERLLYFRIGEIGLAIVISTLLVNLHFLKQIEILK